MANNADLVVRLRADVSALKRDLNRIKKQSKATAKSMESSFGKLKLAAGITAAVGAFIKLNHEATQLIQTAKLLGGSVAGLQEMQFVAAVAGVNMRQLNLAMQRVSRRTAEASMGYGEAAEALRTLGIDANELASAPLEKRFNILADAMQNVQGDTERLRLSFKLFDSDGAKVGLALLNNVGELRKRFKELELGLGEGSIKQLKKINNEVSVLWAVFKDSALKAFASLEPIITELLKTLVTVVKGFSEAWQLAMTSASRALTWLAKRSASIIQGFIEMQQVFKSDPEVRLLSNLQEGLEKTKELLTETQDLAKRKILIGNIAAIEKQIKPLMAKVAASPELKKQLQDLNVVKDIAGKDANKELDKLQTSYEETLKNNLSATDNNTGALKGLENAIKAAQGFITKDKGTMITGVGPDGKIIRDLSFTQKEFNRTLKEAGTVMNLKRERALPGLTAMLQREIAGERSKLFGGSFNTPINTKDMGNIVRNGSSFTAKSGAFTLPSTPQGMRPNKPILINGKVTVSPDKEAFIKFTQDMIEASMVKTAQADADQ